MQESASGGRQRGEKSERTSEEMEEERRREHQPEGGAEHRYEDRQILERPSENGHEADPNFQGKKDTDTEYQDDTFDYIYEEIRGIENQVKLFSVHEKSNSPQPILNAEPEDLSKREDSYMLQTPRSTASERSPRYGGMMILQGDACSDQCIHSG